MRRIISDEERENLDSLRRDLVDPIRSFLGEVHEDTVGDAKRFYAAKARKMEQSVRSAREEAAIRREAQRRALEQQRARRKKTIKKAALIAAAVLLVCLVLVSAALSR